VWCRAPEGPPAEKDFQMRIDILNSIAVAVAVAGIFAGQGMAQTAIPRLPNGKPDLSGIWDKPRVPDMSKSSEGECGSLTQGCKHLSPGALPFTPAGLAKYNQRDEEAIVFDPGAHCWPEGYVRSWGTSYPAEIFQTPTRLAVLFENYGAFHVIPTDGRDHPKNLEPSWFGNSVGHWEGDTLVVDSTGFNDKTWIDTARHPHSEAMHVVERFNRLDATHLGYEVTIEDPKYYAKPFTSKRVFVMMKPGQELMELVCEENNKDVLDNHVK
jgi:hypothetical protein